jgi:hypothetical protein
MLVLEELVARAENDDDAWVIVIHLHRVFEELLRAPSSKVQKATCDLLGRLVTRDSVLPFLALLPFAPVVSLTR